MTEALYRVADDLDTRTLLAGDGEFDSPAEAALATFSAIAGSTRVLFERGDVSASAVSDLRRHLTLMCGSCLDAARRPRP